MRTLACFLLILGIGGMLLFGTLHGGHDWGDDFAAYIMQAKSLTEAAPRGFIEANRFTVEQSSEPFGPVAYPWGFPALLVPFYAAFGLNMIALKTVAALSYVAFLALLWFGFRRAHAPFWFLCLVCLFALNPTLLASANSILSDLPFLLLSTLALVWIKALVIDDRRVVSRPWDSALLGVVIAAAFFVRTNGALLLPSLAVAQIVSHLRRHRAGDERPATSLQPVPTKSFLSYLLPYVVFFSSVAVWEAVLPQGGASHVSHLSGISAATIREHLNYYIALPSEFFSGAPHQRLLYGASLPLAVAGLIRRYRFDYHVLVYMVLTVLLFLVWPDVQGLRFLFPVLPFYVSFALSGLEAFQQGAPGAERRLRRLVCHVPLVFLVLCFAWQSARAVQTNIDRHRESALGPFTETSKAMFTFVEERTDQRSTILFFKPRVMRLLTHRRSIMINRAEQLARGDYLCLYLNTQSRHQVSETVVQQLVGAGIARLVYENTDFRVYRLRGDDAGAVAAGD